MSIQEKITLEDRFEGRTWPDPYGHDCPEDATFETTIRRQVRLALVAAETGASFARRGVAHEPMAWLLASRDLFGGSNAVEACGDRNACMRAVLLHGLARGLDADPEVLDELLEGTEAVPGDQRSSHGSEGRSITAAPRLFTAILSHEDEIGFVQSFAALAAPAADDLVRVLQERYGSVAAESADIWDGFDPGEPLIQALVSATLSHLLGQIAAAPASDLAAGFDVRIDQRFLA